MDRISIINSRQGLRPMGETGWVKQTLCAIQELAKTSQLTVMVAMGEANHELTLYAAGRTGLTLEALVTEEQSARYASDSENGSLLRMRIAQDFGVSQERCTVRVVKDNATRDWALVMDSDIALPISVRPGGNFDTLLKRRYASMGAVNERFRIPYEGLACRIKAYYQDRKLHQSMETLRGYFLHWTRSTNNPWPGETRESYYADLLRATNEYPRSGFQTLAHILDEKLLRSSERHLSTGAHAVSWTASTVSESVRLMRYRARYREMSFEPYAIAIPRELGETIGLQPVRYVENSALYPAHQRHFLQSVGKRGFWPVEMEWRSSGDIPLENLIREMIILTESGEQARQMQSTFGVRTMAVFDA